MENSLEPSQASCINEKCKIIRFQHQFSSDASLQRASNAFIPTTHPKNVSEVVSVVGTAGSSRVDVSGGDSEIVMRVGSASELAS